MLSRELYQQAESALQRLGGLKLGPDYQTRELLLSELYATQLALGALEITPTTPPKHLPGINQVFSPPPLPSESSAAAIIEIAGMPRAGKTTAIERASHLLGLTQADEKWRTLKEKLDQTGVLDYFLLEVLKVGEQTRSLSEYFWQIEDGILPKQPLIMDRSLVDALVFLRANFLFGRIRGEDFAVAYPVFQLPLTTASDETKTSKAFILCLVPPEVSLKGERREKPGRFMNPDFLKILYTQYLRLHAEMLRGPKNLAYACLDLTGSYEANQKLFEKTLARLILRRQKAGP